MTIQTDCSGGPRVALPPIDGLAVAGSCLVLLPAMSFAVILWATDGAPLRPPVAAPDQVTSQLDR